MTQQNSENEQFTQELELVLESDNLIKLSEFHRRISKEVKNPMDVIQFKRLILEKANKISNIISM